MRIVLTDFLIKNYCFDARNFLITGVQIRKYAMASGVFVYL
jgi:hypothetical protein